MVLAGLIVFYGLFFVVLGKAEMEGWDLRVVGNLAVPTAILPLFWWDALPGEWMLRSILIVWLVAFGSVALTTYGKLQAKFLGMVLGATAIYTFWVPALILATGNDIP